MKVMSAVQARLHASMRREFDILVGIIKDFTEPSYPYETGEEEQIKSSDFDARVDVLPVSDPNASTMSQRIMQYQAAMQLAQSAPEMYDLKELHKQMLEVLGIQDVDDVIPSEDDISPVDPVTAVMNLINNKPVKAFDYQDHDAHIQTVAAAQDNPEIQALLEKSPNAPSIVAAASSYINDHLTMKFRNQVEEEMGIELPPMGEPIPADIEKRISDLVAEAASRVTAKAISEAEQARIAEQQKDPLIQMKEREVAVREADVQRKATADEARISLAAAKVQSQEEIEKERIKANKEIAGAKIGQEIASDLLENERLSKKQAVDDYKTGIDIAKEIVKDSN
jgi:hypothetical protein